MGGAEQTSQQNDVVETPNSVLKTDNRLEVIKTFFINRQKPEPERAPDLKIIFCHELLLPPEKKKNCPMWTGALSYKCSLYTLPFFLFSLSSLPNSQDSQTAKGSRSSTCSWFHNKIPISRNHTKLISNPYFSHYKSVIYLLRI